MKSVLEPSVWNSRPPRGATAMQPVPRGSPALGCVNDGPVKPSRRAAALSRFGEQTALPEAEPTTYRATGSSSEQGNLEPSAVSAMTGKLTSPATSRPRGGGSVVVRARESRAHGEGSQSTKCSARAGGESHVCGISAR